MIYYFSDCELDTELVTLRRSGEVLRMRPKVFQVLSYLVEHRDHVVDKQELADQVWPGQFISDSTLESTVRAVRRLLGDSGREQRLIETLYGHGYRFVAQVGQKMAPEPTEPGDTTTPQAPEHVAPGEVIPANSSTEDIESTAPSADERSQGETWPCHNCQHVNPIDQAGVNRFCMACGAPRQAPCPQCGAAAPPEARFCAACGTSLEALAETPEVSPLEVSSDPSPRALPVEEERRQLTVLFCDVVESTVLSNRMDLEDYLETIRAYQRICTDVINRLEGYLAQHLGDGLLVYFGYPVAHEDDARRAIWAGLEIIDALKPLSRRLEQEVGVRLAVRLGVHTGLVIVGDIGTGDRREPLALGESPNLAARLQSLASPNTIIISEATSRLIQGYFTCIELGAQTLKGIAADVKVFQVEAPTGVQNRLDITGFGDLTPMVGRETELPLLLEHWSEVREGRGRVIVLSGEAGIGKSRLARAMRDALDVTTYVSLECQCSPYNQNSAWYPVIELWRRVLRWQEGETSDRRLRKLEVLLSRFTLPLETSMPLMALLLELPLDDHRFPPLTLSSQERRDRTIEMMLTLLVELASQQPVLFLVEDLHWADPSTVELLGLLIEQVPASHLCLVFTCRPTYMVPWGNRSYLFELNLGRLPQPHVEEMVIGVTRGKRLPAEVLEHVGEKTDGVPLFIEELTKTLLETESFREAGEHYELTVPLPDIEIPTTLHDSLMARLDRLDTAKSVAQLGAILGRQFSYALLQEVSSLDEELLQQELRRLVEAELLFQRGLPSQATYMFKHNLIQEVAYQSLVRHTRLHYHQRTAEILAQQFPLIVETQPELLAHHYTESGSLELAIGYWQQAGERAIDRSAHAEAIRHLTAGINLLELLPHTRERDEYELTLQVALAVPLSMIKGYGAVEVVQLYTRARELCRVVGNSPQLFSVLAGLRRYYNNKADYRTSLELGEQHLQLALRLEDENAMLQGHMALGVASFYLGEFTSALEHFEKAVSFYDPDGHQPIAFEPMVNCLSYMSWTLWFLGYPDQSLKRGLEALDLAHNLSQNYMLASALMFVATLYKWRREPQGVQEHAEALIRYAREHGFTRWIASAMTRIGWALAEQGATEEGLELFQRGQDSWEEMGSKMGLPHHLIMLAEVHSRRGLVDDALNLMDGAFESVLDYGERYVEAELYRFRGEFLLQQSWEEGREKAEENFQKAVDIAQLQQAKSLELRSAISLSRLWQQQERRSEAFRLLNPLVEWFTEGQETRDLQEAKALLKALQ